MAVDVTPATASALAPEAMATYLRERLEDKILDTTVAYGQLTVTLAPEGWQQAARLCKQDPKLDCAFFDFLTAVDLREEGFAVVAHLYSVRHRHHVYLRLVAPGGREEPTVPTLTGVYRGANWHERETYDMFGITFEGHPGLLPRILTVENFEGWPLRKEFLLSTREAKPWPGNKEPKEAGADEEAAAEGAPSGPSAEEKAAAAKAKAERAKAKAAEMRARRAKEKAEEQRRQAGGDVEGAAALQETVAEGDSPAQTPEGAAEIAGTDVAEDAAAGAASGDTVKGASQDVPGTDQPVDEPGEEARVGEGAPPAPSGTPGVEAEGRHAEPDDEDSTDD